MTDYQLKTDGPNQKQIEYWNDNAGEKWVRLQDLLDAQLRRFGEAVMDAAALTQGDFVIDIGCGCGNTTLEIARRVGAGGRVLGVDVSAVMLARARHTAEKSGIDNVDFEQADAQTHAFAGSEADLVFSRFGVMFFSHPAAAFKNIRAAIKPGGRLAFVCWRAIVDNPWMRIPTMAAMRHIEIELPADPFAPGPFSLADEAHVKDVLRSGGLHDISVEPFDTQMSLGGGAPLDEVASFMIELGPMGRVMPDASEEVRVKVIDAVAESMAPFQTDAGIIMPAGAWLVSGRPS